jgi:protein CWC15
MSAPPPIIPAGSGALVVNTAYSGAKSNIRSARAQPSHSEIKLRASVTATSSSANDATLSKSSLREALEEKEKAHFEKIRLQKLREKGVSASEVNSILSSGSVLGSGNDSSSSMKLIMDKTKSREEETSSVSDRFGGFDDSDDDDGLIQVNQHLHIPGDASVDKDEGFEDESEEDEEEEDEEEELMRELERIKAEREADRIRKEKEAMELADKESTMAVLRSNPLLSDKLASAMGSNASSDSSSLLSAPVAVKRRFGDDTVFSHTHSNEPEAKKRFINDVIRSDFHRSFMKRFIH